VDRVMKCLLLKKKQCSAITIGCNLQPVDL